jgi:hypothetical protein
MLGNNNDNGGLDLLDSTCLGWLDQVGALWKEMTVRINYAASAGTQEISFNLVNGFFY